MTFLYTHITPLLIMQGSSPRERVVLLTAIFIVICLIGGAAILMFRRRLFQKESESAVAGSLFEQLRAMRDRGEISPEEFEKTRQAMIRRIKENTASTPPTSPSKKS